MEWKQAGSALVAAIVLAGQPAAAEEHAFAERLAQVRGALDEVQELFGELAMDSDVARHVVEKVQADLRGVLDEEQVDRLKETLHGYRARLERNSHWLKRLERQRDRLQRLQRRLHEGLEPVLARLREMEMEQRIAHLDEIATTIAESFRDARTDRPTDRRREIVAGQIETLRMALAALREEGRHDAVEAVERAIHAREVVLQGRGDPEAWEIRERAPRRAQLVEILVLAEEIYREYGDHERAGELSRLTERFWSDRDQHRRRYDDRQRRDLETLEQAVHAFCEADRGDAADLMRRALEARIAELEGARGREADRIRERAPDREQAVELLRRAAGLWDEFGHERKAEASRELAGRMLAAGERDRRGWSAGSHGREAILHRIEILQERLAGMREVINLMQQELQELKQLAR